MCSLKFSTLVAAGIAVWGGGGSVQAEGVVTVRVAGVHSAVGNIMVALCADPTAGFPGACVTHRGVAPAKTGEVVVRIPEVPGGVYAVQAFHDENGDYRPQVPQEGVAFGNGSGGPVTFKSAAVQIAGDSEVALQIEYGSTASVDSRARAAALQLPAGLSVLPLRTDGLYGTLYLPDGSDKRPALLLIGGSEGGLDTMSQMATSFAAEGYATLALAYWQAPGLPQTLENIPLEYFDRALTWLQQQPRVDAARIGMLGWSRGSEAALLTAVRNPRIHAVVAVAPSGVVWPGLNTQAHGVPQPAWTAQGKPLQALRVDTAGYVQSRPLTELFDLNFAQLDLHPEAVIPAEKIRGGVMLISGGNDLIWPSTRFADRVGARLQARGFKHDYVHLNYPTAGHAVFVGAPNGPMARSMRGSESYLGGTNDANTAAWASSWPQVLKFLHTQLKADKS